MRARDAADELGAHAEVAEGLEEQCGGLLLIDAARARRLLARAGKDAARRDPPLELGRLGHLGAVAAHRRQRLRADRASGPLHLAQILVEIVVVVVVLVVRGCVEREVGVGRGVVHLERVLVLGRELAVALVREHREVVLAQVVLVRQHGGLGGEPALGAGGGELGLEVGERIRERLDRALDARRSSTSSGPIHTGPSWP